MQSAIDLAFLFIGGEHQVLHLAPVAAEISRRHPDAKVQCICADGRTAQALRDVASRMAAKDMKVVQVALPWASVIAARLSGIRAAAKGPLLAKIRWRVRGAQAIIVPERTSAALRLLGWCRPLIHFRHGAGDRAPSSEARLKAFDAILVPGEKDVERAVEQGIDQDRLRAIGYVKLDYLQTVPRPEERLFDNDRPIILYNPHFDPSISSIAIARDVIERFREQDRYNLIFAPHIRTFENLSPAERAEWRALAVPERILVDLDSPRLFNMRYVQAAALYLGDMSSQLYEFLARPRPAVFLNAHGVDWRKNRRYSGWHLGEVAMGAEDVLTAIDLAFERHPGKIAKQTKAVDFAFGRYQGAIRRSADALLQLLPSFSSIRRGQS